VCVRSVKGAVVQELVLYRPHRAPQRPVELLVQRASLFWELRARTAADLKTSRTFSG
jgi:hypothetical protein